MGLHDLKRKMEARFASSFTKTKTETQGDSNGAGFDTDDRSGTNGNSVENKYSSILDGGDGVEGAKVEPMAVAGRSGDTESRFKGVPSFYSPRRYDRPPDPADYSDVPF